MYLHNLLHLFTDKGVIIQQTVVQNSTHRVSSLAAELGTFLPVISILLSHKNFPPSLMDDAEIVILIRNMWFQCVLFGLLLEPMWLEEWQNQLSVIAKVTPVLVPVNAAKFLEIDLEFNPVVKKGFSDQTATNIRSALAAYLPENAYYIKSLPFAQTVFLFSVWHIASMKAKQNDCTHMLNYFKYLGSSNCSLTTYLENIAEKTVEIFIQKQSEKIEPIDSIAEASMREFIIASCHGVRLVADFASTAANKLANAYPMLLTRRNLLRLAMELVQLLWESCESKDIDEVILNINCSINRNTVSRLSQSI